MRRADGRANQAQEFLRGVADASRLTRAQRVFFAAFGFLDDEGWTPPLDAVPAVALRDDAATPGGTRTT